jgi:cation transporter-like permease
MNASVVRVSILVLALVLLLTPLVFAGLITHNHGGEEEELPELSVITGLLVFASLVSTVTVAFLMKAGKAKIKAHHTLAFLTLTLAVIHLTYNLVFA